MCIEVMTAPAADQRRRATGPQELLGKAFGSLRCVEFPGLMPMVHLLLVGFGLPAGQIREHARKADLHEGACGVKASILSKEIQRQPSRGLAFVETGMQIDLGSDDRIVGADPGLATVEALQLEQLRGVSTGDVGVDVDVQEPVTACVTHGHYCLQRPIIEQSAATYPLDPRVGAVRGDNRVPVRGVLYLFRAGLSSDLDRWS